MFHCGRVRAIVIGNSVTDNRHHAHEVKLLIVLVKDFNESSYEPRAFFGVPERVESGQGRIGNHEVGMSWYLEVMGCIECVDGHNDTIVQTTTLASLDEEQLWLSNECQTMIAEKVQKQRVDRVAAIVGIQLAMVAVGENDTGKAVKIGVIMVGDLPEDLFDAL